MSKATLTFPTRQQAEDFAKYWTRFSKEGTMIGAGTENVIVLVYDIDEDGKKWIDNYISNLNQKLNP